MRIAYVCRWDVGRESGILRKIAGHVRTWLRFGHEVRLFAMSPGSSVWSEIEDLPIVPFHGDGFWTRLTWRGHVSDPIMDWNPELIYYRFGTYYPAIDPVQKARPSVVEINSDDVVEYRLVYPLPLYWAHRILRGRVLGKARGLVCVTGELARRTSNLRYGKPTLVMGNGIDLSEHEPFPAPGHNKPRVVFVGTRNCPWHGIDRLIAMARLMPEVDVDVVGYGPEDVEGARLPNLHLHGYCSRKEYEDVLRRADVAVSSLALYRNSMNEGSPLKTREYLAHGLPTILAYVDTDFLDGHDLLLQIPNTPTNVEDSIGEIREFIHASIGRRIPRADVAHLDVGVKERKRLSFMQEILDAS